MTSSLFLTREDIKELTDCGTKAGQVEQLRRMGIPFFVGASGWPKVAVAAIEGKKHEDMPQRAWKPAVLHGGRIGG